MLSLCVWSACRRARRRSEQAAVRRGGAAALSLAAIPGEHGRRARRAVRACKRSSYWTARDSAECALAAYAGCLPTGRQRKRPERSR